LVDFDSVCQAEPALDLGQFLIYLRITSLKSKLTPTATKMLVEQVSDRFMHTYMRATGHTAEDAGQLRARVSVYKSINLLRCALRSWQKFKPGRIESALAVLEEETSAVQR
jgi:hypothetical protein